jgi:hypothetical protein
MNEKQIIQVARANLTREEMMVAATRARNKLTQGDQMRIHEVERIVTIMCDGIGPYAARTIVNALATFIAASNNVSRPD